MKTMFGVVLAAVVSASSASASSASAQSPPATWNGLSDRFQIDTGYFRLSADTLLRYDGPRGEAGEVDVERDLGDFLYINLSPGESEAAVTDWRIAANYFLLENAGLGAQYKYNRYSYDRGILVSELGGEVTIQGFQVFLSFRF